MEEDHLDKQEDQRARDGGVGDIKCPPPVELETEKIDIKEIDIDKIHHSADPDPVDQVADRPAADKRQRDGE